MEREREGERKGNAGMKSRGRALYRPIVSSRVCVARGEKPVERRYALNVLDIELPMGWFLQDLNSSSSSSSILNLLNASCKIEVYFHFREFCTFFFKCTVFFL